MTHSNPQQHNCLAHGFHTATEQVAAYEQLGLLLCISCVYLKSHSTLV